MHPGAAAQSTICKERVHGPTSFVYPIPSDQPTPNTTPLRTQHAPPAAAALRFNLFVHPKLQVGDSGWWVLRCCCRCNAIQPNTPQLQSAFPIRTHSHTLLHPLLLLLLHEWCCEGVSGIKIRNGGSTQPGFSASCAHPIPIPFFPRRRSSSQEIAPTCHIEKETTTTMRSRDAIPVKAGRQGKKDYR